MIYDCFMFFNELDLLEVRLHELNDVVDKFIISESTRTFSNQPKELIFQKNMDRFKEFLPKIEYMIIDDADLPPYDAAWTYENYQRDVMEKALKGCSPEDLIIISDLDEIPDKEIIKNLGDFGGIKVLDMLQYNFYLNYINSKEPVWLRGTRVFKYKELENTTLTAIRLSEGEHIPNAGWHFSFLGGIKTIKYKIQAFAHQEYNNEYYTDEKKLEKAVKEGKDIFERGYEYKIVPIDKSFPQYIQKNKDKFKDLILKQSLLLDKIPMQIAKCFEKKPHRRFVQEYKPKSKYSIIDFISPNTQKILEIGGEDTSFSQELQNKFGENITKLGIYPDLLEQIQELQENFYDCVVFNDNFNQIYDPEKLLSIVKSKMNINGYIVATVFNIRYFDVLKQIFSKKTFDYCDLGALNKKNIRFYTKKSLEHLFHKSGYFFITFKGLNPIKKAGFKILNFLMFNNLNDSQFEKFIIVTKY